ncbi:MAG: hypothetical protein J6Q81_00425 [Lentisphaeria bacterium]|nr:hypothetical protein [Lentisphaeria bacterium]
MLYRIFMICTAALLLGTGCSENQPPDPPSARAELTARLFETLKSKRYTEALAITDKLLSLDSNDAELMDMRDRIIGNIAAIKVQEYVEAGQLKAALKYLARERKLYPVMPRLRLLEEEVRNLITLRNAAQTLAAAKTIPELAAALDMIAPLAARYPAAKQLHKDIALRKAELKKMRSDAAAAVEKAAAKTGAKTEKSSGKTR